MENGPAIIPSCVRLTRRDSALWFGNYLKLRDTEGYQSRVSELEGAIIGP